MPELANDGTDATVIIDNEGERHEFSPGEYVEETRRDAWLSVAAREQARLAEGTLRDHVMHNANVVDRAQEEGVFYGRIRVPYWFRQKDDEVAETFGDDDHIDALIEDHSEDAWRIVAKRTGSMGDRWYNYAWTFVPKSVSTVTRVEGVETEAQADDVSDAAWETKDAMRDEWEEF